MDKKEYIKKLLELDMQFEIAVKSGKEKLIEIIGERVRKETELLLTEMTNEFNDEEILEILAVVDNVSFDWL
jgi:hypothetical protein